MDDRPSLVKNVKRENHSTGAFLLGANNLSGVDPLLAALGDSNGAPPTGRTVAKRSPLPARPTPTARTTPPTLTPMRMQTTVTPTETAVVTSGGWTKASTPATDMLAEEHGVARTRQRQAARTTLRWA